MQTYSHLLVNAVAGEGLPAEPGPDYGAFVLGGLLPDLPLLILSAGYLALQAWGPPSGDASLWGASYDALYFGHPVWISSHSLLHSPLSLTGIGAVGSWAVWDGRRWGRLLLWLVAGAALHSVIDILTHHGDGPLLLFPLDWSTRWASPISYWDPGHGAATVSAMEHALDLGLVGYLIWRWRTTRAGH